MPFSSLNDVPTYGTTSSRSSGYVASRNPRDTANPYSYTVNTIGGGRISATATVSSADMQMHDEIKQRLTQDIRDKLYADMYGLDALKTIKSLEAKVHILEMEMYKLKQKDSK